MKRFVFAVGVALLFLYFFFPFSISRSHLELDGTLDDETVELGEVAQGDIIEKDLVLSNPKHSSKKISAVKATCSCTAALPQTGPKTGDWRLRMSISTASSSGDRLTGLPSLSPMAQRSARTFTTL